MSFDPKTDSAVGPSRKKTTVKEMYQKLLDRGDDDLAAELRNKDTVTKQVHFLRDVPDFDPEHDTDVTNTARLAVKNVYEALRELGYDDHADELRTYTSAKTQRGYALTEILPEIDAEIDPVTGEYTAAESDSEPADEKAA